MLYLASPVQKGRRQTPRNCKQLLRWHFRKKMTEGLSLFFINSRLESTLQSVCRLTAPLAQGSLSVVSFSVESKFN